MDFRDEFYYRAKAYADDPNVPKKEKRRLMKQIIKKLEALGNTIFNDNKGYKYFQELDNEFTYTINSISNLIKKL